MHFATMRMVLLLVAPGGSICRVNAGHMYHIRMSKIPKHTGAPTVVIAHVRIPVPQWTRRRTPLQLHGRSQIAAHVDSRGQPRAWCDTDI